ncbi:MAG TPA: cytochrome c biogenesis protein CcsA [Gemmataceae bacterium]|jgi:ABC-type transport system involved in cytochrome c biogenesis permease subunit|nr:cytochrome c biogenesis protein CcsA [Gemmataceae bacterium]
MSLANRIVPAIVVAFATLRLISYTLMPDTLYSPGIDLAKARRIPVVDNGRVKPLDTVANVNLRILSNHDTFRDKDDHSQPAILWLLEVMSADVEEVKHADPKDMKNPVWGYEVFRIENDQVAIGFGAKPKEGLRYSYRDLATGFEKMDKEIERIKDVPKDKRTLIDNQILEINGHVHQFQALIGGGPLRLVPPQSAGQEWQTLAAVEREAAPLSIALVLDRHHLSRADVANLPEPELRKIQEEALEEFNKLAPAAHHWDEMFKALQNKKYDRFNELVAGYPQYLTSVPESDLTRSRFEVFFNKAAPFFQCCFLYVGALILGCLSWMFWTEPLRRSAFWLLALTALVHTFGVASRMYISGRPPIINLYSTAIFIGWTGVLVSLVLERFYPLSIANVVGGLIGFLTSIVAHHLGNGDDTLQVLEAVLDTNFWLATHVVCINLGYMATFVGGVLGIIFIFQGLFTAKLDKSTFKDLSNMLYGVVCFATFLSFTGTVLGGIWADQSWGRFWGWDPKENGAVLIVLWNVMILHARWCGLVQQRGMAIMAVFGNIVTLWSYFGTNSLGIGLHSYGFMAMAIPWMIVFVICHLAIMAVGMIPPNHWRSFGGRFDVEKKPEERPPEVKRRARPLPAVQPVLNAGSTAVTAKRPR